MPVAPIISGEMDHWSRVHPHDTTACRPAGETPLLNGIARPGEFARLAAAAIAAIFPAWTPGLNEMEFPTSRNVI